MLRARAFLSLVWLAFFLALAAPSLAASPAGTVPPTLAEDLARWEETAKRAEEAIRSARASDRAFEILRAELADERSAAFSVIERGDVSADVIRAQIDALGPAPGKDGSEPEPIASRRAELESRLAVVDAPVRAAREAYNRTEVLIADIDSLLRARFRASLLERSPSPLLPSHWPAATADMGKFLTQLGTEIRDAFAADGNTGVRASATSGLLAAVGLVLLLIVGPLLRQRLDRRVAGASGWRGNGLRALSLVVHLILPAIGAAFLVAAVDVLQLSLHSLATLPELAMIVAVTMVAAGWIGDLVFAPGAPRRRTIDVSDSLARTGKRACLMLGAVLSLEAVLYQAAQSYSFLPATKALFAGLVVFAGAFCLWRIAAILLSVDSKPPSSALMTGKEAQIDFLGLLARLIQISAAAAVIAVAIGYVPLARQALHPMILTLLVIGLGIVCYRAVTFLIRFAFARSSDSKSPVLAMLPLVFAITLILAVQPILALIWGARVSDLTEVWVLLVQGVEIGGTRISIGIVFILLAVFLVGLVATRWLQRLLGQTVLPRTRLDRGGRNAVLTGLGYVGITLSALLAISMAGLNLASLAIVAGALSVGIGFGLQAIVSNFVSGIILLVERPIKEGDWIEVSGNSGIVRKIAVRATRIETFDRHEVILPNSDLIAGTVTNMTLSSRTGRVILPVGIAYGSDLETAQRILLDAAARHAIVLEDPAPVVLFMGLGDSSLNFELRCFLRDISSSLSTKSELLFEIYRDLNAAGIEIPFPQRDVNFRNLDELAGSIAEVIRSGRNGPAPAAD